jgi:hypothetical protein
MEGTSGAAERALLRGRAREAALSCEGPRQRAPGRAGARASDCEVDSCREANQLPMTPASPGGGSSRVCDRRCPSQQGWGEASTASGRGGRSCPRDLNSLRMAPDPRDLDWPTTQVARPSAARSSPKGERGFGAQAPSSLGLGRKPHAHESGGKLHQRATAGVVLRSSGGRGRARGSHSVAEVDRRREATLAHVRRARGPRGTV